VITEDLGTKVKVVFTYREAELLYALLWQVQGDYFNPSSVLDMNQSQFTLIKKLEDKLDEYCNT
jgi:hypothetical protein